MVQSYGEVAILTRHEAAYRMNIFTSFHNTAQWPRALRNTENKRQRRRELELQSVHGAVILQRQLKSY